MLHFSLSRRAGSPEYGDRKRWWGPDEVHHALHPANPYNEFPSPFSHCMHGDIQLAIKHGLVIQWLMSLALAMKGLGESQTLGPAAPRLLFLSCFRRFLSSPFATSRLSLYVSSSLHYREDGEDHLQFSNLYDSALFNRRPLFPVCRFSLGGCDISDLQHPGAVSFAAVEGF